MSNPGLLAVGKFCPRLKALRASGRLNLDKLPGSFGQRAEVAAKVRHARNIGDTRYLEDHVMVAAESAESALYGSHLPGAGEGSDGEQFSDEEMDDTLKSRYRRKPTKLKTFFGIPQVDAKGLADFAKVNGNLETLDLAYIPDIGDPAVITLVESVKRTFASATLVRAR